MEKFEDKKLTVKQSTTDADWLIVSTAVEDAQTHNIPSVVVGTDTDLLVIVEAQASPDMDFYLLCGWDPMQMYAIKEIQTSYVGIKSIGCFCKPLLVVTRYCPFTTKGR